MYCADELIGTIRTNKTNLRSEYICDILIRCKVKQTLKTDYIIIGAGIAGASLALELDMRGYSILLIDAEKSDSSSNTAAGIVNPIVPKRVIPAWNANEIFPGIVHWYKTAEDFLGAEFYESMPMYQIHASLQERQLWERQSDVAENKMFLEFDEQVPIPNFKIPFGATLVHHCGRLDVKKFCHTYFLHHQWLCRDLFF